MRQGMKKQRLSFLFDFDGTLADTRPHIIRLINRIARRHGLNWLDTDDPGLRDLSMRQLLDKLGISLARLPGLVREVRREMRGLMPQVRPIEGMVETLHKLRDKGIDLGLVSSNEQANIDCFAEQYRLPPFNLVATGSALFGKTRVIRKIIRRLEEPSQVYYVGDESRDIDAAQKAKIGTIAVSWGFNSREHLAAHHPDYLVDSPQELIDLVFKLEEGSKPPAPNVSDRQTNHNG